jgi:hypothetical protein
VADGVELAHEYQASVVPQGIRLRRSAVNDNHLQVSTQTYYINHVVTRSIWSSNSTNSYSYRTKTNIIKYNNAA